MNKKRRSNTMKLIIISLVVGVFLLAAGPVVINYIFLAEMSWLQMNLAFNAGNLLDYYGAILGGLVTCFAIISAIHINNLNIKEDRERAQFERAYEIYHKMPEILTKLDSAAIHLQYSVHISDEALLSTLDTMKECDEVLQEQHYMNERFYNKNIDSLLKNIAKNSSECQKIAEKFLRDKEDAPEDYEPPHAELETAFTKLRESIESTKTEITSEINKFIYKDDN